MRIVAAGVEPTYALAAQVAKRHSPDVRTEIAVGPTSPAAAIQHAVRHGMTVYRAGVLLVMCTVGESSGSKRNREEPLAVYVLIGPSMPATSGDDCSDTHVHHQSRGDGELSPDRDRGHVHTKRHC
jgi:hypothetical protein